MPQIVVQDHKPRIIRPDRWLAERCIMCYLGHEDGGKRSLGGDGGWLRDWSGKTGAIQQTGYSTGAVNWKRAHPAGYGVHSGGNTSERWVKTLPADWPGYGLRRFTMVIVHAWDPVPSSGSPQHLWIDHSTAAVGFACLRRSGDSHNMVHMEGSARVTASDLDAETDWDSELPRSMVFGYDGEAFYVAAGGSAVERVYSGGTTPNLAFPASGMTLYIVGSTFDTFPSDGAVCSVMMFYDWVGYQRAFDLSIRPYEWLNPRRSTVFFVPAATFAATASTTTGGATCSASATFSPGTKTATAAPSVGGATCSASASHTPPTFAATATPSTGGAAVSVSASFSPPVYTATAAPTAGGATAAAAATFAGAATRTATASPSTGGASAAATATFTAPIYAATAAVTVGGASMAAFDLSTVIQVSTSFEPLPNPLFRKQAVSFSKPTVNFWPRTEA